MQETAISWTKYTWNPFSGCVKVSQGCKFCYAEALSERVRGRAFPNGFGLTLRPHKLKEPFGLKEPSLIFVNSMSDLFLEEASDEYRDKILDVIDATPQHQYQVLTKRPQEMLRYSLRRKLPANFWAGVSIESNRYRDRADVLRQVEAEIRFISAEPLIGPLNELDVSGIAWVIGGGESGQHLLDPKHRAERGMSEPIPGTREWRPIPARMYWMRDLRDLCVKAGVAFYLKQWGGRYPDSAGHELDGREWREFPKWENSTLTSTGS